MLVVQFAEAQVVDKSRTESQHKVVKSALGDEASKSVILDKPVHDTHEVVKVSVRSES